MPTLPSPQWSHPFANLGSAFHVPLSPTPLPEPYWVGRSQSAAGLLGLSSDFLESTTALHAFTGNVPLDGTRPIASVYSGHQFGHWAGQLGDGRAILLGETAGHEVQLKGAGLTPFSRMGDGRAVLRSSIREFLCSEAMHALGIPTTRALCITGSDEKVYRERIETAAVVTRLAPSFIRFGHFEHFCHHDLHGELRQLADYVIDRYYPACRNPAMNPPELEGNVYAHFLRAVAVRTAEMVAKWQAVGFCHGVLNTDNMSILGLTIDYGPFQFLDGFDPHHICNHSDTQGRYAFARQPQVVYWNLYALGQALLPLIGSQDLAVSALEGFRRAFTQQFDQGMAAKLGLTTVHAELPALVDALLQLLAKERVDYTIFWRRLSQPAGDSGVRDLFVQQDEIARWLLSYKELLTHIPCALYANLMKTNNPKFVLRNHLGEMAIRAAQGKDYSLLAQLQSVLETPFDEHVALESFADFPPDWAGSISISCSS